MILSVDLKKEYIPEWNGNADSSDPIKVIHKVPTMALANNLIPKPVIKMKVGKEGTEGGETEMTIDTTKIVKEMVIEIKNLTIDYGNGVKNLKDGDDLFSEDAPAMLQGLADELGKYFQTLLTDRTVNTKN